MDWNLSPSVLYCLNCLFFPHSRDGTTWIQRKRLLVSLPNAPERSIVADSFKASG